MANITKSIDFPNPQSDIFDIPDIFQIIEMEPEVQESMSGTEVIESNIQDIILNTEEGQPTQEDIEEAASWLGVDPAVFSPGGGGYGSDPFGFNFTGSAYTILSSLAYALDNNQNLGEWLMDTGKSFLLGEAQSAGLGQVWNNISFIKNELTSMMDMGISFQSIQGGDVFNAFQTATNNAELIVNHFENIINNVDEALTYVTEKLPEDIANIVDYIDYQFEQVDKFMDKLFSGDFSFDKIFENLPGEIMDGIMNLDFVQDIMRVPRMVINTISTIQSAVASITMSPPAKITLKELLKFCKTIKQILQVARQINSQIQNTYQRIKAIYDNLANGKYFQTAFMLIQGGLRFVEIPIQWNTVYPHGNNWRTPGGHAVIEDNTPGKEQKTYMHPKGSSQNFDPEGNVTTKATANQQVSAGKNLEFSAGEMYSITGKTVTIEGENVDIHDKGTGIVTISADSISITADVAKGSVNIGGGGVSIVADPSASIHIAGGTGLTLDGGMGPVTILSKSMIAMDAPMIGIGSPIPGMTSGNPTPTKSTIITGASVLTAPTGLKNNNILLTPAGEVHLATMVNVVAGGPITLTAGGPIALN